MADSSFDIVSKVDHQEVDNALNQTAKEISQRFDFKNVGASIKWSGEAIRMEANSEERVKAILDVFETKMVKRGISLKALEYGKVDDAAGGTLRQVITLKQGIAQEKAKQISQAIRDSKLKVKAEIRGEELRVTGAKKDELQAVIQLLRSKDFGIELQFVNYR